MWATHLRERERERERETPASLILGDVRLCTGGLLEWEPVDEGGGFSRNWQYLISTVDFDNYNFAVHQGRASDRQENTAGGGTGKKQWWRAGGDATPIQCELLSGEALYLPAHWVYEEHTHVPYTEHGTGLVSARHL